MLVYALTIFLGAFLLFEIEPILGKHVLPWFGGGPAVWTTCLLFFQLVLLAGYVYAHWLIRRLRPAAQRTVHLLLLGLALALLVRGAISWSSPVLAGPGWKPQGGSSPIPNILALLAASVGLPYFLLSTTGPLLQAWAARTHPAAPVYRLYALSNAGSLLAPLTYPFLVEPVLTLRAQAGIWSGLFAVFAAGAGFCAWRAARVPSPAPMPRAAEAEGQAAIHLPYAFWFALSACGSIMLLATTNQICQEVAAVPFLWLLPLCLYLLTFILCFESDRLYSRAVFGPLLAAALGWAAWILFRGYVVPARTQVLAHCLALFASCMVCHGELARSRPHASRLTSFYLTISAGGAAGGIFVAILAPSLFHGFWELHMGLWLSGLLALVAFARDPDSWLRSGRPWPALAVLLGAAVLAWQVRNAAFFSGVVQALREGRVGPRLAAIGAAMVLAVFLLRSVPRILARPGRPYFAGTCLAGALGLLGFVLLADVRGFEESAVSMSRNFYGVLTVEEKHGMDESLRRLDLRHGRIVHGFQYQDPKERKRPTTYYAEATGIGLLLRHHPRLAAGPVRVGVVGLGVGTIAAYGRAGDSYRFYDINPAVADLSARPGSTFTYLRDSAAKVSLVLGDARLSLERELARGQRQDFDVLAIDAFNSDSIPIHLLTREAVAIYLAHLRRPGGVLAVHISNRHLDLAPVVRALADAFRLEAGVIDTESVDDATWGATWVLLARDRMALEAPGIDEASGDLEGPATRLWTDDYSNLFRLLK